MTPEISTVRPSSRSRHNIRPGHKPGYVLPRLLWMAIGPGVIMVLSVLKLDSGSDPSGAIDLAFLAVACGIVVIRWGTWFRGDHLDSFGGKTNLRGLVGFTGLVAVLACGIWALATIVASQQLAS